MANEVKEVLDGIVDNMLDVIAIPKDVGKPYSINVIERLIKNEGDYVLFTNEHHGAIDIWLISKDESSKVRLWIPLNEDRIFISDLEVKEGCRHQGLGGELVNLCENVGRKIGKKFSALTVINFTDTTDELLDWYEEKEYHIYKDYGNETLLIKALY